MKKFLCAVVGILVAGSMMAGTKDDPKAAAKADLKLMSFNLRYYKADLDGDNNWIYRKEAVVKVVKDENPDVVGFQEPRRPQVDYLKVNLNDYGFVDMGIDATVNIVKYPDGGGHLMLMYKKTKFDVLDSGFYWLSETPDKPSLGWDARCRRVTVWVCLRDRKTGKKFWFFDTHFDHIGPEARRHEAEMSVEKMREIAGDKAAVFTVGDFNAPFANEALNPIKEWMSGARETAPLTDDLPSFNNWGKSRYWIDHIFYRKAKCLQYRTIVDSEQYGVPYLSDHNPIVALFKL